MLFLSPFFYPEIISTGKYNSFLVQKLIDSGFDVDVVAFHPFYPDWIVKKTEELYLSANIYRFGAGVRFPKSQILRRIILEVFYTYFVVKYLLKRKNKYDTVISIFPPVLFMLLIRRFIKNSLRIGIVHDVQGIMANTEKKISRRISASVMAVFEKFAYRNCDRLICLSHSMREVIINKFDVSRDKCAVFYPFVSIPNDFSYHENIDSRLEDRFEKGFKHVVYSGALGEKQQPFKLFDFFLKLSASAQNIKCHIFSRGPVFNELVRLSSEDQKVNENLYFHDLVPEKELDALFHNSTVQVIPQAPGTGAGAFPSKLPNLLSHGVPVFAICDQGSELETILQKVDSAKTINSWELEAMESAMYEFLACIDGQSHEENFMTNKKTILNEFDADSFIESLTV